MRASDKTLALLGCHPNVGSIFPVTCKFFALWSEIWSNFGSSAASNPQTEFLKADQNKEQSTMKRSSLALVAATLVAAVGMSLHTQAQTQNQAPSPVRSRSDEMLNRWNDIGNKLVAMAKDFPKDRYD